MSMLDVWIVCTPAQWAAIEAVIPESSRYCYENSITGFWRQPVFNVLGTEAEIAPIVTALGSPPAYAWTQGDGLDSLNPWPTDPTAVLALMADHADGTAPTLDNPNWGHVFLGQSDRVFAGDFSSDFGGDFY